VILAPNLQHVLWTLSNVHFRLDLDVPLQPDIDDVAHHFASELIKPPRKPAVTLCGLLRSPPFNTIIGQYLDPTVVRHFYNYTYLATFMHTYHRNKRSKLPLRAFRVVLRHLLFEIGRWLDSTFRIQRLKTLFASELKAVFLVLMGLSSTTAYTVSTTSLLKHLDHDLADTLCKTPNISDGVSPLLALLDHYMVYIAAQCSLFSRNVQESRLRELVKHDWKDTKSFLLAFTKAREQTTDEDFSDFFDEFVDCPSDGTADGEETPAPAESSGRDNLSGSKAQGLKESSPPGNTPPKQTSSTGVGHLAPSDLEYLEVLASWSPVIARHPSHRQSNRRIADRDAFDPSAQILVPRKVAQVGKEPNSTGVECRPKLGEVYETNTNNAGSSLSCSDDECKANRTVQPPENFTKSLPQAGSSGKREGTDTKRMKHNAAVAPIVSVPASNPPPFTPAAETSDVGILPSSGYQSRVVPNPYGSPASPFARTSSGTQSSDGSSPAQRPTATYYAPRGHGLYRIGYGRSTGEVVITHGGQTYDCTSTIGLQGGYNK